MLFTKMLGKIAFFLKIAAILLVVLCSQAASSEVINPVSFGAIADDDIDDSAAFQAALDSLNSNDTLAISQGRYVLCSGMRLERRQNIIIKGSDTVLEKCQKFNGEYLLYVRHVSGVLIEGIEFRGLTTGNNYHWGEQGVYLGSTNHSTIKNNKFYNFGDACLRVTTSPTLGPIKQSSDSKIISNYFSNCTQITTTQTDRSNNYGGTNNIVFIGNTFSQLKGSLKLASRTAVSGALIDNNVFYNSQNSAIELVYYSDVMIRNNYFDNTNGYIVNAYPNCLKCINRSVDWGGIEFVNNTVTGRHKGIRVVADMEGELINSNVFDGINISGNKFLSPSEQQSKHVIRVVKNKKTILNFKMKDNIYTTDSFLFYTNQSDLLGQELYLNAAIPANK